jgi:hypothetical protein
MKPVNSIAEMIVKLQQESFFYAEQINKNTELIQQLEPLAEWVEVQQPEEPETAPDTV